VFYCEKCGNEVIRSYPSGKIKIRTNIIVFENDKCICKCLKCKSDVEIPLVLHLPTGKVVGSKKVIKLDKKKETK
jgi:hypothetical protein